MRPLGVVMGHLFLVCSVVVLKIIPFNSSAIFLKYASGFWVLMKRMGLKLYKCGIQLSHYFGHKVVDQPHQLNEHANFHLDDPLHIYFFGDFGLH
ncbi:hypothetical protein NC652_016697 [Populus alba x Populus x berolinensis]|nr:hypothetical protein NC652_016697 [Populus alba x Populus x berolinensis]